VSTIAGTVPKEFLGPISLCCDESGESLYIADKDGNRITKVSSNGNLARNNFIAVEEI